MCGINEDDIALTVESAFTNARFPERIYFGIIDQRTDGKFSDVSSFTNVKKVNVSYPHPLGLGLGRLNALMLHEHQDYCLQIDAHTIFDKKWDSLLLADYTHIAQNDEVIVISTRPKWYEYDELRNITFYDCPGVTLEVSTLGEYEMTPTLGTYQSLPNGTSYGEHFMTVGGFVFSKLSFFCNVMPDPRIAFYGEEQSLALRASTRGFKIYAINDSHLYSLGKNQGSEEYTVSTHANSNEWKNIKGAWTVSDKKLGVDFQASITDKDGIVKKILDGDELGYWGAPTNEAYDAYISNLGFDYRSEKPIVPLADDVNPQ